jgi:AMMECR1 domain-containing protein
LQKELFLSHLCAKAGLEPDFWKTNKLDIFTYQSEVFSE